VIPVAPVQLQIMLEEQKDPEQVRAPVSFLSFLTLLAAQPDANSAKIETIVRVDKPPVRPQLCFQSLANSCGQPPADGVRPVKLQELSEANQILVKRLGAQHVQVPYHALHCSLSHLVVHANISEQCSL
jgi:hypothetical protein